MPRLPTVLLVLCATASLHSDRSRASAWRETSGAPVSESFDEARIRRMLDEAVRVYRTSGREIPFEFDRIQLRASFDFPACLEPLVINRQSIRPTMSKLVWAGRLLEDQQLVADLCWRFMYDPKAEVILSHFQTADGLAFCGVNVTYEIGRRLRGR